MSADKQSSRTVWDYIKAIGAFGILLSVFSFGFSLAGSWWASTISNLNHELSGTRIELNSVQKELDAVKQDYQEYVNDEDNAETPVSEDSLDVSDSISGFATRKIEVQNTEDFFDDEVSISLVAIPFEGDPERHMVVANVIGSDGSTLELKNKDVGSTVEFGKTNKYRISITEIETFSATFVVTKL